VWKKKVTMKGKSNIAIARRKVEGSIKLVLGTLGVSALLIAFILLIP
jgi:hypothetical protein